MTGFAITPALREAIYRYALFKQTPVLLRQMVQFGPNPLPGLIFLALQFICEELPIRLAKKVKDLELAPFGLNEMPLTLKVRDWYAQLFAELTSVPQPKVLEELAKLLSLGDNTEPIPPPEEATTPQEIVDDTSPYADDGIVLKRHHPSRSGSGIDDELSPTYGLKYYTPCPANIVWPKEVYDYNKQVNDALTKIKKRHDATVATMAQGVQEWKQKNLKVLVNSQIQAFLDKFYLLRIGIRMLIGQHIALNMAQALPTRQRILLFFNGAGGGKGKLNYVGVICTDCNVADICQDAIETALYICEDFYGLIEGPEIQLITLLEDILFMYVPGHLIHMLFETLKNSLRATIEFHTPRLKQKMVEENPKLQLKDIDINDLKYPPIKVIISEGLEDIAIKISDEGGGIALLQVPLIWTYLYTTVNETPLLESDENSLSFKAPMAGFGYGLPILRLYAQYFGGDLKLILMEGYGTDVYLHLNRLSSSLEPLP